MTTVYVSVYVYVHLFTINLKFSKTELLTSLLVYVSLVSELKFKK